MGDEVLLYTHPPTAAPQEDERCWKCGEDGGTSCGAAHCGLLEDEFDSAAPDQEVHDALCPALTGGKCSCSSSPATVDKAWSQFCGGIGRGADAPYPGMIQAFEANYGQSFTDKDWRNETGIWAAAWGYAVRRCNATPTAPAQSLEQIVKDSILYGTGVSLGGKRIHPNDIYTAPAQPLTEQRIHKIWRSLAEGEGLDEFARAIEAAHGIKGASL
jgi:hypothetical protein